MQSKIIQSEKLASIGQLAAGVAHEMNTPVGFVASNFQTLESYIKKIQNLLAVYDGLIRKIETSKNTELLNKANAIGKSRNDMKIDFILEDIQGLFDDSKEGLNRVTNIIQNLRDFSRIDQPGSLDEYNLNDGVEATLVVAKNEIKYDAELKTELSEVPLVFCNSGQINQVFLNILVNAAQAIKSQERDDKGTITIRTYATETGAACEISDDGCGIPPDSLPKIFDPFFTTKAVGKGTGLGLSVSYDIIVNKHKGELLVDSTVGKGSKFTIKLPIGEKEPNDNKETENSARENSIICGR
jgi:signal transduction histidine kinase